MGAARFALTTVMLVSGGLLILLALAGSVLIVEWLRHPGGIGMEWIVVPVVGLIALASLICGGVFLRLALRRRPRGRTLTRG
jgi:hypothetical protein